MLLVKDVHIATCRGAECLEYTARRPDEPANQGLLDEQVATHHVWKLQFGREALDEN